MQKKRFFILLLIALSFFPLIFFILFPDEFQSFLITFQENEARIAISEKRPAIKLFVDPAMEKKILDFAEILDRGNILDYGKFFLWFLITPIFFMILKFSSRNKNPVNDSINSITKSVITILLVLNLIFIGVIPLFEVILGLLKGEKNSISITLLLLGVEMVLTIRAITYVLESRPVNQSK